VLDFLVVMEVEPSVLTKATRISTEWSLAAGLRGPWSMGQFSPRK
jgi:hypothetical protein